MLGETAFCSWVAFVPWWKTAKKTAEFASMQKRGFGHTEVLLAVWDFAQCRDFSCTLLRGVLPGSRWWCLQPFCSFQWKLDQGPSILENAVIVGSVVRFGSELFFCLR